MTQESELAISVTTSEPPPLPPRPTHRIAFAATDVSQSQAQAHSQPRPQQCSPTKPKRTVPPPIPAWFASSKHAPVVTPISALLERKAPPPPPPPRISTPTPSPTHSPQCSPRISISDHDAQPVLTHTLSPIPLAHASIRAQTSRHSFSDSRLSDESFVPSSYTYEYELNGDESGSNTGDSPLSTSAGAVAVLTHEHEFTSEPPPPVPAKPVHRGSTSGPSASPASSPVIPPRSITTLPSKPTPTPPTSARPSVVSPQPTSIVASVVSVSAAPIMSHFIVASPLSLASATVQSSTGASLHSGRSVARRNSNSGPEIFTSTLASLLPPRSRENSLQSPQTPSPHGGEIQSPPSAHSAPLLKSSPSSAGVLRGCLKHAGGSPDGRRRSVTFADTVRDRDVPAYARYSLSRGRSGIGSDNLYYGSDDESARMKARGMSRSQARFDKYEREGDVLKRGSVASSRHSIESRQSLYL